ETFIFFRPDRNERMLKIGGRDFLIDDSYDPNAATEPDPSGNGEKTEPVMPYNDKLVTDKIALKKVIRQEMPDDTEEKGGVSITLQGYQWAELDISPDYLSSFKNFGDGTFVALTA